MDRVILSLGWIINVTSWASAAWMTAKYFKFTFTQGWNMAGSNFKTCIKHLLGGALDAFIIIFIKKLFGDAGSTSEAIASATTGAIISIVFILHRLQYLNIFGFLESIGERINR